MFRIAIYLAATLLMLSGFANKCEFAYNEYLQSTTSTASSTGKLSESDALAVMRDYIKVNNMEHDGFELRLVGRVQIEQGDFYLLVYFDPVNESECGNESQVDEFSTMPVFNDGYFFKVEAKTGNVELYKTKETFIEGQQ